MKKDLHIMTMLCCKQGNKKGSAVVWKLFKDIYAIVCTTYDDHMIAFRICDAAMRTLT